MSTQEITNLISAWSIVLPAIIGSATYNRLEPRSRIIFYMVLVACIPQLTYALRGEIVGSTSFTQEQFRLVRNCLYNINVGFELFFLHLFFSNVYSTKRRNLSQKILTICCILSGITLIILNNGISEFFLTKWLVINNLTYSVWVLLLLLDIYENDKRRMEISTAPMTYLIGLFLYTSCTILYFSLRPYLSKETSLANLGIIHDIFNTLLYLLFSLGFLIEFRVTKNR